MVANQDKYFWLWFRRTQLTLLKKSLEFYNETKDKNYLDHAKSFGQHSLLAKQELKKYD